MTSILYLPIFGILITIACYAAGHAAKKIVPSLAVPQLVSTVLVIIILIFTPITLDQYMVGGNIIIMFIGPVTILLALKIYQQRAQLKANIIPLLGGCIAGSLASITSVWFFSKLFNLDYAIIISILPKSITSAIAMELAASSGGFQNLAISMVVCTGVISATFSPLFIKVFKLKDPVAVGIAMGSSGHALGTATAIQLGETEGAMSSLAIPVMGIITSIIWMFML